MQCIFAFLHSERLLEFFTYLLKTKHSLEGFCCTAFGSMCWKKLLVCKLLSSRVLWLQQLQQASWKLCIVLLSTPAESVDKYVHLMCET